MRDANAEYELVFGLENANAQSDFYPVYVPFQEIWMNEAFSLDVWNLPSNPPGKLGNFLAVLRLTS